MALAVAEKTNATIDNSLADIMNINGAIGVALVDWRSGLCLGALGGGTEMDMHVAAAGNTEVVRAKQKVMSDLKLNDTIEDILITLGHQLHIVRPLRKYNNLFLYAAFHKDKANLAMTRYKMEEVESKLAL